MRRILVGAVAAVCSWQLVPAPPTHWELAGFVCAAVVWETCWCKRPALTVFRWVTPGRWHHIGLTAEEKQSRHSQA